MSVTAAPDYLLGSTKMKNYLKRSSLYGALHF